MAIHARQLALEPDLQIIRRSRRPLLPGLEQAHRSALAHHVHRIAPMGARVLINGIRYYIAGSRDDLFRPEYELARSEEIFRRRIAAANRARPVRVFNSGPDYISDTLNDDVDWEMRRLRIAGIQQVIVIDLTKREFHLPVVRVVIPGLEGPRRSAHVLPGPRARAFIDRHQ